MRWCVQTFDRYTYILNEATSCLLRKKKGLKYDVYHVSKLCFLGCLGHESQKSVILEKYVVQAHSMLPLVFQSPLGSVSCWVSKNKQKKEITLLCTQTGTRKD